MLWAQVVVQAWVGQASRLSVQAKAKRLSPGHDRQGAFPTKEAPMFTLFMKRSILGSSQQERRIPGDTWNPESFSGTLHS